MEEERPVFDNVFITRQLTDMDGMLFYVEGYSGAHLKYLLGIKVCKGL